MASSRGGPLTDTELKNAAVAELKLTTTGWNTAKTYTPEKLALTHWGKGLKLLAQISSANATPRNAAVVFLKKTTRGYVGPPPTPSSNWGKALSELAKINEGIEMNVDITMSESAAALNGTVTATATVTPASQRLTPVRCQWFVDNVYSGATDTSYPLTFTWDTTQVSDGAHKLRAEVLIENRLRKVSLDVTVMNVPPSPPPSDPPPAQGVPVNTVVQTISDTTPTEGQTLTVSNGEWTNNPTSYTRCWDRCDAAGNNCIDIPSSIGETYTVQAADVGSTLRCWTTAFNSVGASQSILSAATSAVAALAPSVPVLIAGGTPVISGTPTQGNTLSIPNGNWTNSPTSYTHCWTRCDANGANCVTIAEQAALCGSLNATYVLTAADVGKTIKCYTTAINATGSSASVLSAATAVVQALPSPPPSGGIAIDSFSDCVGGLINRWKPEAGDYWSNWWETGVPYANGGGMFEVSTPYGAGFRFKVTSEMTVPSGGQLSLVSDQNHLLPYGGTVGRTEDWSGRFMFPSAGNVNGFPGGWRGVVWEWHTASMSGNHISLDLATGRLQFAVYLPGTSSYRYAISPLALQLDHWYSWRTQLKWSWGTDGFFKGWLDGVQLANFTGATVKQNEQPWLQFGFYCGNHSYSNEALHAEIRQIIV